MQIQGPWNHEKPHFPLYHSSLSSCHLGMAGGVSLDTPNLSWSLSQKKGEGTVPVAAPRHQPPALGMVVEASSDFFKSRQNLHNIKCTILTILKYTIQWFFSILTVLCNHHPYLITEHYHPTENSCPPYQSLLMAPPPTPVNHTSAFRLHGFACLDISYKWNCTICGIWGLASSTQHHIFEVHPHCDMYQSFTPFYG